MIISSCFSESWHHCSVIFNEFVLDLIHFHVELLLSSNGFLIVTGLHSCVFLHHFCMSWEVFGNRVFSLADFVQDLPFACKSVCIQLLVLLLNFELSELAGEFWIHLLLFQQFGLQLSLFLLLLMQRQLFLDFSTCLQFRFLSLCKRLRDIFERCRIFFIHHFRCLSKLTEEALLGIKPIDDRCLIAAHLILVWGRLAHWADSLGLRASRSLLNRWSLLLGLHWRNESGNQAFLAVVFIYLHFTTHQSLVHIFYLFQFQPLIELGILAVDFGCVVFCSHGFESFFSLPDLCLGKVIR